MRTLYFVSEWSKNKAATWSGTCYGLFKSLSKLVQVIDIETKLPLLIRLPMAFLKKYKLVSDDLYMSKILMRRLLFKNKIKRGPVLQFDELVLDSVSKVPSYNYIDATADQVLWLYKNDKKIFDMVGYLKNVPLSKLKKRVNSQNEYFSKCSGIFTMGKWIAKDLVSRTGVDKRKVHAVGGGINLDNSKIKSQDKQSNKILFVGREYQRKGLYPLIEAYKEVLTIMPNAELHVAGPSVNPIQEDISNLYFYGECDSDAIADLMNKCDIFVMPSYYEAYGLVFIEALTFGLPCIGRNTNEMPYLIENGETGYIIEDDNTIMLSNKIIDLLKNERIKKNVANKREWYLKEYSWNTVAKRIVDIINRDGNFQE